MHLIVSTSLHPNSRSRILAQAAAAAFAANQVEHRLIDLAELPLPLCDGDQCYGDPNVQMISQAIQEAQSVLIAAPVYNYDVSAACKNLIELTGKAWTDTVVGFLLAAGGQGSYMSVMGIANSLMLDFRSLIIPRFVYATGQAFAGDHLAEVDVADRIQELTQYAIQLGTALAQDESNEPQN